MPRPHRIYLLLASASLAASQDFASFCTPLQEHLSPYLIFQRQDQPCPVAYNQCTQLGSVGENDCCPNNQVCSLDDASQPACCPTGFSCTGTLGGETSTADTTTTETDEGSTSSVDSTQNSVTSYASPSVVTTTVTATTYQSATPAPTATNPTITFNPVGTVPNQYYPFTYIAATFPNVAACSTAWSSCQLQSTDCLLTLASKNGVTVVAPSAGTTVLGPSSSVLSAANSICSSLSSRACFNLQLASCSTVTGSAFPNGAAARDRPGMALAAGAGALIGAVGVLI